MNLQTAYDLAIECKRNRDISRKARLYETVPVRELVKRGWLADTSSLEMLEKDVCRLLEVSSLDEDPVASLAAKKSTSYGTIGPYLIAWYKRALKLASCITASAYNEDDFDSLIDDLLKLTGT